MVAETPTLVPAIQAVSEYVERHGADLTPEHAQILFFAMSTDPTIATQRR